MFLKNTVGKRENAGNQHFLLFPQCFLLYQRGISSFGLPLICRLQNFKFFLKILSSDLRVKAPLTAKISWRFNTDKDQTEQNLQPDLRSTMSTSFKT